MSFCRVLLPQIFDHFRYYYLNTLCSYFLLSNVFFSLSSRCLECLEPPPLLCLLFPCFINQPFFSYLICFYFQPTNYSFSPNFLNFVLIYINYLKFSDYFCFFLTFSLTLSNLPFSISSIIRLPFTSNSIYLATTVPILPSFAFVFGIYSLLCTLTLYFFRISYSTLYHTHPLTKSPTIFDIFHSF